MKKGDNKDMNFYCPLCYLGPLVVGYSWYCPHCGASGVFEENWKPV